MTVKDEQLVEIVTAITAEVLRRLEAPSGPSQGGGGGQVEAGLVRRPAMPQWPQPAPAPACGCTIAPGEARPSPAGRATGLRAMVDAGACRVSALPGTGAPPNDLAWLIDHTLLKPDATPEDLHRLCTEARQYGFASVCVNSANVRYCVDQLRGSPVRVCAVVGFPLGAQSADAKAYETARAIADGACEIDMVINVGALKAAQYDLVYEDIRAVVAAAAGRLVKVILETGLLEDEQIVAACALARAAGADYVKTSTGFGHGGATVEHVRLMRKVVGPSMGVKASGGIRDAATARAMLDAGATRLGASSSVAIAEGTSRRTLPAADSDY